MDTAKVATPSKADLTGIRQFNIELQYGFLKEPIIFPCKILLAAEDKAARQAFYALPDGDCEAAEFEYEIDMMTRIVVGEPKGLPGFAPPAQDGVDLASRIRDYFATGEPILRKIATEFLELYNRETTPPKFFR